MISKEIADSGLSFYIVEEIDSISNGSAIFEQLRNCHYKNSNVDVNFLSIIPYEIREPDEPFSSFLSILNGALIIRDVGIFSTYYFEKLTEIFPNKVISTLIKLQIDGDESVTGGIFKSHLNGELILHIRKIGRNNNDILFDKFQEFIPENIQSEGIELERETILNLINDVLIKKLKTQSLKDFKIRKYNQIRFQEFDFDNIITRSIKKNFPIINDDLIIAAYYAGGFRSSVDDPSLKLKLFPNAKDVHEILANILNDLLDESFDFIKSQNTFRRKKKDYIDEIIIGGSDRTGFGISFKKRYLVLEKLVQSIEMKVSKSTDKRRILIINSVEHAMSSSLTLESSWHNFATQLYYYLNFGFKNYYPLFEKLEDIKNLNQYINHSSGGNSGFSGTRFFKVDQKPLLENCIVAKMVNDDKFDDIIDLNILSVLDDQNLGNKFKEEIYNLLNSDNKP